MEKHKIDELFSQKLDQFEATPAVDTWEQIAEQLRSKTRALLVKRFTVAASVALVVLSGYFVFQLPGHEYPAPDIYITNQSEHINEPLVLNEEIVLPLLVFERTQAAEPVKSPGLTLDKQIVSNEDFEQVKPLLTEVKPDNADQLISSTTFEETRPADISPDVIVEDVSPTTYSAPPDETAPVLLASNQGLNESIQIIYKQGKEEEKSNISKALTFMDDVRKGDKKLLNFNKIKNNFFNKDKEEVSNSK